MRLACRCAGRQPLGIVFFALMALASTGIRAQDAGRDNDKPDSLSRTASIQVNNDDSITVTETTRVSRGAPFRFHRDLAAGDRDWTASDVTVLSATENGAAVATRVDDYAGGVRIGVGATYANGTREYTLVYRLADAVIHAGKQDRVDWPVISRPHLLAVDGVDVQVTLPQGTPPQVRAWFRHGYVDLALNSQDLRIQGNQVSLHWPSGLHVNRALSMAISYPSGGGAPVASPVSKPDVAVAPPWTSHGSVWLALLVAYYLGVKFLLTAGSRDSKAVIPEYAPPRGLSAAALRVLWHNGYDGKCLAAGILGIAAKGGLTVSRRADGTYVATRAGADVIPALTFDERALRSSLFALAPSIAFTRDNADGMDLVETVFRAVLQNGTTRDLRSRLDWLLVPGWLVALTAAAFLADMDPQQHLAQLVATVAIAGVASTILTRLAPGRLLRATHRQAAVVVVACLSLWATDVSPVISLWIVALLAVQVFAGWWLPRQPRGGTELLRHVRGFRWYLATAEQQDLDARYKPSLHAELRASFLPYAMALDVEVEWNQQFAGNLQEAVEQGLVTELIQQQHTGHLEAAAELLGFASALSRLRPPQ